MLIGVVVAILLLIPVVAIWLVSRRGLELKHLADRGRPVTGRVVDKEARHSKGNPGRYRRVQVAYERPDTGAHARWIVVNREEWEVLVEGAPVELVYLPDRPAIFATRTLVNQGRAAKGLPPPRPEL